MRPGVELDAAAAPAPRQLLQVREQRTPHPARALLLVGDEIIYIELASCVRVVVGTEHGHTDYLLVADSDAHLAARCKNRLHLSPVVLLQMRTQLAVDGLGPAEPVRRDHLMVVVSDTDNLHGGEPQRQTQPTTAASLSSPSWRNISRMPRIAWRVRPSFSIMLKR